MSPETVASRDRRLARQKVWYQANKQRVIDYNRERYRSDPAHRLKVRTYINKWRNKLAPEKQHAMMRRTLLKQYGLTPVGFAALLAVQGGVCRICKQTRGRQLHVDHCHATGRVRGLLCWRCNNALGLIGEENLENAVAYLKV